PCRGARVAAHPRTAVARTQHPAVRRRRPSATRRTGRRSQVQHRRCVRGGHRGGRSEAMNSRAMLWSVRRELWENRSIYLAPLAVGVVIVFGALVGMLPAISRHSPHKLSQPYDFAAVALMGTMFIVSIFYCLDALYGERRDRSILFWKSTPVSDWTTVHSKMA